MSKKSTWPILCGFAGSIIYTVGLHIPTTNESSAHSAVDLGCIFPDPIAHSLLTQLLFPGFPQWGLLGGREFLDNKTKGWLLSHLSVWRVEIAAFLLESNLAEYIKTL